MAAREEVYCKFGIAAEAAQLFETDLNTLLLAVHGVSEGWHMQPNPEAALRMADTLDAATLGALLNRIKSGGLVQIDDELKSRFASALQARNLLVHGFFERHGFRIQTSEGREMMIADLEKLHAELFQAWQIAQDMMIVVVSQLKKRVDAFGGCDEQPGS